MERECPNCFARFVSKELLFSHIKTCGKSSSDAPSSPRVSSPKSVAALNDALEDLQQSFSLDDSVSSSPLRTSKSQQQHTESPGTTNLTRSNAMYDRVKESYIKCRHCDRTFLPSRIHAHENACLEKRQKEKERTEKSRSSPSQSRPSTPRSSTRPSSRNSRRPETPGNTQKLREKKETVQEPQVETSNLSAKYLIEETIGIRVYGYLNKSKEKVCLGEIIIDCNTNLGHVVSMINNQLGVDCGTLLKNGEVPLNMETQSFIPAFCFLKKETDYLVVLR
ncbi:hypothetical protein P9112_012482 [Eukaryota sp. TZLM1-RC]